jgi:hypothetical protein
MGAVAIQIDCSQPREIDIHSPVKNTIGRKETAFSKSDGESDTRSITARLICTKSKALELATLSSIVIVNYLVILIDQSIVVAAHGQKE